jgi:hypothetical protein
VNGAPAFSSATEALEMARAAMGFLAAADATAMPAAVQAQCLQALEEVDAVETAARSSILRAFAGRGYCGDGAYSARAWLFHQGPVTRVPVPRRLLAARLSLPRPPRQAQSPRRQDQRHRLRPAVPLPLPDRHPPAGLDPHPERRRHHHRLEQRPHQSPAQPRTTRPPRVTNPAAPQTRTHTHRMTPAARQGDGVIRCCVLPGCVQRWSSVGGRLEPFFPATLNGLLASESSVPLTGITEHDLVPRRDRGSLGARRFPALPRRLLAGRLG